MIIVLATIKVAAGRTGDFLKHFTDVVPHVRSEDGCIEYGPLQDLETSLPAQTDTAEDEIVVLEKWESLEHLEEHLIAPHMVAYRSRVAGIVESVALRIMQPVDL